MMYHVDLIHKNYNKKSDTQTRNLVPQLSKHFKELQMMTEINENKLRPS